MKKQLLASLILVSGVGAMSALAAGEYSGLSNDDLFGMREQMRYMGEEDRQAYRTERQQRMQSMSQEERRAARDTMESGGYRNRSGSERGHGSMNRSRQRDGSGSGGGRGRTADGSDLAAGNGYGQSGGYGGGGGYGRGGGGRHR